MAKTTSVMMLETEKTYGEVASRKVGYLLRNTDIESEPGMSEPCPNHERAHRNGYDVGRSKGKGKRST